MDKYVLILGAGRGQLPLMKICKKYGYNIVVVSPKGDYPGLDYADKCIYEDIRNKDEILAAIRDINVVAAITDQLDEGVTTVAYISEKLKIKGITSEIAEKFQNKYVMRTKATLAGVAVPKSIIANSIADAIEKVKNMNFPLMIKPVDSSASRGIFKVNSCEEIENHFLYSQSFSKNGFVIIEEFIEGKEYVVESYTHDYKIYNLVVGHRDYFDIPNTFIPSATVFVDSNSAKSHIEKKVLEANNKLIKGFSLPFGITHGEFLYNEKEDKVYLVEIAARGGGVFISSDLIPLACGVNANELLVKDVLNMEFEAPKIRKGSSAYFCYLTPKGIVNRIEGIEELDCIKGLSKSFFDNIEIGYESKTITDKSSRKGPFLVYGKTKEDCYNVIAEVKKKLKITLLNDSKEISVIWN